MEKFRCATYDAFNNKRSGDRLLSLDAKRWFQAVVGPLHKAKPGEGAEARMEDKMPHLMIFTRIEVGLARTEIRCF